jgi:hypothetical protein
MGISTPTTTFAPMGGRYMIKQRPPYV